MSDEITLPEARRRAEQRRASLETGERLVLTIEETARRLGIGLNQCYAAAKSGEIPTIRIGKRFLVPAAALKAMLANAGA